MRILKLLVAALMCAGPLVAQERPNTILVMDGSGSMWGQIDGTAKIEIAQKVVANLVGTIPSDQGLGLTVYGHRQRGDCTDIETVVSPAPGTADQIRSAVSGIKPLGKTPMTDAVIAAAEALRYTEDKATVILVSDGVETCNPDPCAAARLLEEAGIDFTAHVVGFDVGSNPEALAQMQCIAKETGGQFLTADDAQQLEAALVTVAQQPEPEPVMAQVTFEARLETEAGPLVDGPVLWSLNPPNDALDQVQGNGVLAEIEAGSYEVTAYWIAQEVEANRQFIATENPRTVVVVFEKPAIKATVTAPATAPVGSSIEVSWNGPDNKGDVIGLTEATRTDVNYVYRFATSKKVDEGKPMTLLMPTKPGNYVVEYSLGKTNQRIGFTPITLTPVEATITAPARVDAGSTFEAAWTGPGYKGDFLGISKADYKDQNYPYRFVSARYTINGNSVLRLKAPTKPGQYLVEYAFGQDTARLVSVPLEVVDVAATLTAPATVAAGSVVEIGWTGPNYDGDFIAMTPADYKDPNYPYRFASKRAKVAEGAFVSLRAPTKPGKYLVEYVLGQDTKRQVAVPIEVTAISAVVTAPASAPAGSLVEVAWTGPGYPGDYLGVTPADYGDPNYPYRFASNKVKVEGGETLMVQLPTKPGAYVVEYGLGQNDTRLTSTAIEVTPVSATLTAPSKAAPNSAIEVKWTGPNYPNDFIGITPANADDISHPYRFVGSTSKVKDSPLIKITTPKEPGDYVIEYAIGLDKSRLHAIPLTIE